MKSKINHFLPMFCLVEKEDSWTDIQMDIKTRY